MRRLLGLAAAAIVGFPACSGGDDFSSVGRPMAIALEDSEARIGIYEEEGSECFRVLVGDEGSPCVGTGYQAGTVGVGTWSGPAGTYVYVIAGRHSSDGGLGPGSAHIFASSGLASRGQYDVLLAEYESVQLGFAVVPEGEEPWGLHLVDAGGDLIQVVSLLE